MMLARHNKNQTEFDDEVEWCSAMDYEPQIGDLVWAKMKSFPPWPGRVVKPGVNFKKQNRKGNRWIYFFGSKNYGWVDNTSIKPYEEFKEKFHNSKKTAIFKKAVSEIEEYIVKRDADSNFEAAFDKVLESENKQRSTDSPRKSKKRESSFEAAFDDLMDSEDEKPSPKPKDSPKKNKKTPAKRSSFGTPENNTAKKARRDRDSPVKSEENGVEELYEDEILDLPPNLNMTESTEQDFNKIKKIWDDGKKVVSAGSKRIGFMGLGNMGTNMVMNLIHSGHRVNLWNRSSKKCEEIKKHVDEINNQLGSTDTKVQTYQTPCDVVENSDIIFSCLADPRSAKEVVIGNCGVIHEAEGLLALAGKGYVEMTSIDPETSKDICDIITQKGGRYLELQVQGSKKQAADATLIALGAGDFSLFEECQSCIKAISKSAFFLGSVGSATKMNLCLNMALGIGLVGFAESLVLASKCGLSTKDFLNIFQESEGRSNYLCGKGELINSPDLTKVVEQALVYMQKDIKLCLDISNDVKQNLPIAAAANEAYKAARRSGYDQNDVATVYKKITL